MGASNEMLEYFKTFSLGSGGIGSWLMPDSDCLIFQRIAELPAKRIGRAELNQLLVLGHQAPVSEGFFRYYWLQAPSEHPYDLESSESTWFSHDSIGTREHLKWGLNRIYTDGLLWFGNVRTAYRELRGRTLAELEEFFLRKKYPTARLISRGAPLDMEDIPRDRRYLISEMACKSFGEDAVSSSLLSDTLLDSYRRNFSLGQRVTIRELLSGERMTEAPSVQMQLNLSADDILDELISSDEEILRIYARVADEFNQSRAKAMRNTALYMSMAGDMDVYVATSMRTRSDFREMAKFCDDIFRDRRLADFNLRHFNPTLSAAAGHEDKGLIECLMVKCSKVLVYCAGEKESYGKDAEAAMALSLGKPVIFYCTGESRMSFYKDVHPLSRLIDFSTGVPVGAIVTDDQDEVVELLLRIFHNKMQYELEHAKRGYLRLREKITNSVVRLQSGDNLLTETFWNHYHAPHET